MSAHSVSLSWEPPLKEQQNGHLTGYVITISKGAELKQQKQQSAAYSTNATIAGLTGNTHYTLRLAAKTSAGMGPYSPVLKFKTKIYGKDKKLKITFLSYHIKTECTYYLIDQYCFNLLSPNWEMLIIPNVIFVH